MLRVIQIFAAVMLISFNGLAQQSSRESIANMKAFALNKVRESASRDLCTAGFVYTASVDVANGLSFPVGFSNISSVTNYSGAQFIWDFGDGVTSTEPAPVHVYTSYNPYYITCLTLIDGACTSSFCDTINLDAVYNANPCNFTFVWEHSANASNVVNFFPGYIGADNYTWDFGDGTSITTPGTMVSHGYAEPGTYQVCLNTSDSTNDCVSATCAFVVSQQLDYQLTGPMQINQLPTVVQSIQNILFGSCVDVTDVSFYGSTDLSIGYFSDTASTIGFDYGLLLTTGLIFNAIGPNNQAGAGTNLSMPGDYMLDQLIPGYTTRDAVSINFTFTPLADTIIACEFVFASEEYPEFVGSTFNDVFGFFINGPGTNGWQNIAYLPGTNIPISINNVNQLQNGQYYVNNSPGTILQYDAYTTPIALQFPVQAGQSYQFRIIIADAGDGAFDSGVFIKGGSFLGNTPLPAARFAFDSQGMTVQFDNESSNTDQYTWSFGDGNTSEDASPMHTYDQTGFYNVRLSGNNICYACDTMQTIAVTPGQVLAVNAPLNSSINMLQNGNVQINYALINRGDLNVEILTSGGQLVRKQTITDAYLGTEEISLDNLAAGMYIVRLSSGMHQTAQKVLR